jgi:hypothetical protein
VKGFLICIAVLVVAVVALGFWRGWFEVGGKKEDEKAHANVDVNLNKLKADKDAFKKLLGEKTRAMKDKIVNLEHKAKELTGDAKTKMEKEIASLTKRHETLEKKMGEVEGSSEEKFKELTNSLTSDVEESEAGGKEKEDAQSK